MTSLMFIEREALRMFTTRLAQEKPKVKQKVCETFRKLYDEEKSDAVKRTVALAVMTEVGDDAFILDLFMSIVERGDVTDTLYVVQRRSETIGEERLFSALSTLLLHVLEHGDFLKLSRLVPLLPEEIEKKVYADLPITWWFMGHKMDAVMAAQHPHVPRHTALALAELIEMDGKHPGWVNLIRRKRIEIDEALSTALTAK